MSQLQQALESGKFVVTGEIGPPKGVNLDHMWADAEYLKGKVAAVNVTDIQSSVMRIGSMAVCHMLADRGQEPIFQMTCRDRNRLALESDLLSAHVLGIENVLALTGDHVKLGDHAQAKPVFDLDSVTLLQTMSLLESGKDLGGSDLDGSPTFFKGAVVTPCAEPVEPQIIKMEKKVEAGAQFFQTQAVYDPAVFEAFMKKVEHLKVPVLVGIVLLKSAGMAKFMNANVAGVSVPDNLIKRMSEASKQDRAKVAIEIAAEIIRAVKDVCQGAHIMPLGWDKHVPAVIEAAGV